MVWLYWKAICGTAILVAISSQTLGAELLVGVATADITPPQPAPLSGQFHLRISTGVETPLTANVVAIESRDGEERKASVGQKTPGRRRHTENG